jgi:hypothetical protein
MQTLEILGWAGIALLFTVFTAQTAFAYGRHIEAKAQRIAEDKGTQPVLNYVNNLRPSRRLIYRKVNPKHVGSRRYLNSKLAGEVLA